MRSKIDVTREEFIRIVKTFEHTHGNSLKNILQDQGNVRARDYFLTHPVIQAYLSRSTIKFVDNHPLLQDSLKKEEYDTTDHYELEVYRALPGIFPFRDVKHITQPTFYTQYTIFNDSLFKEYYQGTTDIIVGKGDDVYSVAEQMNRLFSRSRYPTPDSARFFLNPTTIMSNHGYVTLNIVDPSIPCILATLVLNAEHLKEFYPEVKKRIGLQFEPNKYFKSESWDGSKWVLIDASHDLQTDADDNNCALYTANFIQAIVDFLKKPEIANRVYSLAHSLESDPDAKKELIKMFQVDLRANFPCYYDVKTGAQKPKQDLINFHLQQRWKLGTALLPAPSPKMETTASSGALAEKHEKAEVYKASVEVASTSESTTKKTNSLSKTNISMQVLSGFIAVAGCAAVAIAFTLLNAATFGVAGLLMAGVGIAATLLGVGLFAVGANNNERTTSADQLSYSAADLASTGI
jgi:DNA-directed RNA polymerase subunit L